MEVATQESAHLSHDHTILDTIMQGAMVTETGNRPVERERRRLNFHEWEDSGAVMNEVHSRNDIREWAKHSRGLKDVLGTVAAWKKVSRDVEEGLVGQMVGGRRLTKLDTLHGSSNKPKPQSRRLSRV